MKKSELLEKLILSASGVSLERSMESYSYSDAMKLAKQQAETTGIFFQSYLDSANPIILAIEFLGRPSSSSKTPILELFYVERAWEYYLEWVDQQMAIRRRNTPAHGVYTPLRFSS